jgi:hypothetical protein
VKGGVDMKARNVSVTVVDVGGELYVSTTFHVPGSLQREDPPNDFRVRESARKKKQKAIQRFLESLEIPDDQ